MNRTPLAAAGAALVADIDGESPARGVRRAAGASTDAAALLPGGAAERSRERAEDIVRDAFAERLQRFAIRGAIALAAIAVAALAGALSALP